MTICHCTVGYAPMATMISDQAAAELLGVGVEGQEDEEGGCWNGEEKQRYA